MTAALVATVLGWMMALTGSAQISLDPASFTSVAIGGATPVGAVTPGGDGYTMTGGGTTVGGLSDSFQFYYQSFVGDFDVSIRVESLSLNDAWTKAGLMARESATPNSRYAASMATPAGAGTLFLARTATGGDTTNRSSTFPVTYPNTWLRLKRVGTTFTGYAGLDGASWTLLGTSTLPVAQATPMLVGLALVSQSNSLLATAQFRTLANVTGTPPVGSVSLPREPIGPSSRRTELVISEIMYHPRSVPVFSNRLEYIELYNSQAFDAAIGGFRISGNVDYTFPAGTVMKPGQFLVVARDPGAMQSYYGITGVLGPWHGASTNSLPGGSGTVRLRNRQGAVMLEVNYKGGNPWPVAADGAGHSLVLNRASYGERDSKGWSASDTIDGSPGKDEPFSGDPLRSVVINEFLAHTSVAGGLEDYVELYNHSRAAVNLSGAYLTDEAGSNKYRFAEGTTLGATNFLSLSASQLGFSLSADGERIFLVNSNQSRVIDAIEFGAQADGVSFGRIPDGGSDFYQLASRTPGAPNGGQLQRPVVINELMYNPISGDSADEYIELYNRSGTPVDVGLWKFTSGVNFTLPTNTVIPVGGYLVVAKSQTNLLARYNNLSAANTVGDYGGTLANGGERVALSMPQAWATTDTNGLPVTNILFVTVSELSYENGGRWGYWADGGGSSMELTDPNGDTRQPGSWADSDESSKVAPWTSYEFVGPTGDTLAGNGEYVMLFMLGVGECLVDDVEVRVGSGANLVANPGFETGLTSWVPQGSHDFTTVEDLGFSGTKSLHVRAGSRGDNGPNRVRGPALSPIASGNVTIRAKVRWLRGWPEVVFRVHGGGAEATGAMQLPKNLGSPGAANSRRIANAGPSIWNVSHAPALPQAGESVVVSAKVADPDGTAAVRVRYRIDNGTLTVTPALFTSLTMVDDGTGGDTIAGDGVYSATLPGQPINATLAFYVEAVDGRGATNLFPQFVFPVPGQIRSYPNDSIARECVLRYGDRMMPGSFATYHLWMTVANSNRWAVRFPNLNNTPLDGTFVYNNYRVVYNSLPLFAGSPWHRGSMTTGPGGSSRVDFVQNFPTDDQMLGATDFVLNNPGNPGGTDTTDKSAQSEQASYIIFDEAGVVYNHRRYVHHFMNGDQRSTTSGRSGNFIFEDSQQPNGDMLAEWFPNDTGGNLYKIEDWFEWPVNGSDFESNNDADLSRRAITVGGTNVLSIAPYRFMFRARSVGSGGSANDYGPLFQAIDAISPTAGFAPNGSGNTLPVPDPAALEAVVNVEQWMRIFACQHTIGNWDSYGYRRGKNDYTYKPQQGGFEQMTWDIDFTMGIDGDGTGQTLWDFSDPRVTGMMNTPIFVRYFWRALNDIVNTGLRNTFLDPILDQKQAALLANGVNVDPTFVTRIKAYVTGRRAFLLGELARVNAPFTVFGANNYNTNLNLLSLSGSAPITVAQLRIGLNGASPVAWPHSWVGSGPFGSSFPYTATNFALQLILTPGQNVVVVQGVDRFGVAVPGASRTINVQYTGAAVDPVGALVFSEIMYNPPVPGASYVEINNRTTTAFDASGWRVNGLDYTFPPGAIIAGGQNLLLAKNRNAFLSTYTNAPAAPFGQFNRNLDPAGETLSLLKTGTNGGPDVVISQVRYEPRLPWGPRANGQGASLQLVDSSQDISRASNWADREAWRFVSYTGIMGINDTNFLIYVSTIGDAYVDDLVLVTGTVAQAGQNLLVNSGFEDPLANGWTVLGNHTNSAISTQVNHTGSSSLHVVSGGVGSPSSSVRQDVFPNLTTNTPATLSFWFLPTTTASQVTLRTRNGSAFIKQVDPRPIATTPGGPNVVAAPLPPYDPLWLNEVQPENTVGQADNFGQRDPWLELYNAGSEVLDLSGYYLSDNYDTNLTRWQFPAGASIGPKEFKIVWADGEPQQTANNNLHTSFRLNSSTGSVALVRVVNRLPQITDYLTYARVGAGQSYGDYPDGQPFHRQVMVDATPGRTNIARFVDVLINEWVAGNTNGIADPADGKLDDWFELHNHGTTPVDLGGFFLTDKPGSQADWFMIPTNSQYVIPAGGFLLVWADGTPAQNSAARPDLHVPFLMAKAGDTVALISPDGGSEIDHVSFGLQVDDVAQGRFPDGSPNIVTLTVPTPRTANVLGGGNTAPQLAAIQSRTIRFGQTVSLTANATDADVPAQALSFDLLAPIPTGAAVDANSGLFTWTPAPNQAPSTNNINLRVRDNGVPSLSASRSFTVVVLLPPRATIARSATQVSMVFDTISGRLYKVQYKDSLSQAAWTDLAAPQVAGGTSITATDSINAGPQRFYRILQLD